MFTLTLRVTRGSCLLVLVLSLDLAPALDPVQDGRLHGPAGVRRVIDGHAIAAQRLRRAVLQALIKARVVQCVVPAPSDMEYVRLRMPSKQLGNPFSCSCHVHYTRQASGTTSGTSGRCEPLLSCMFQRSSTPTIANENAQVKGNMKLGRRTCHAKAHETGQL